MLIRSPADVDELEAAWALACATMTPAFTDTTNLTKLKRCWPDSNTLSKVAVDDHVLVGCCLGWREATDSFIAILGVAPKYQRSGVGRALVEAFCASSVELGSSQVTAGVREPARPFYERLGFAGGAVMAKPLTGGIATRFGDYERREQRLRELRALREGRRGVTDLAAGPN